MSVRVWSDNIWTTLKLPVSVACFLVFAYSYSNRSQVMVAGCLRALPAVSSSAGSLFGSLTVALPSCITTGAGAGAGGSGAFLSFFGLTRISTSPVSTRRRFPFA